MTFYSFAIIASQSFSVSWHVDVYVDSLLSHTSAMQFSSPAIRQLIILILAIVCIIYISASLINMAEVNKKGETNTHAYPIYTVTPANIYTYTGRSFRYRCLLLRRHHGHCRLRRHHRCFQFRQIVCQLPHLRVLHLGAL